MKILLFVITLVTSLLTATAQERDAHHWASLIGKGVNLCNALEAPKEGEWGVTLDAEYFKIIADAGFNSVRIPIRWSAHAAESAPYLIDEAFFDRVDWVIKEAISNGLVVIFNIQHYEGIFASPEKHKARFLALWKQISGHYKDFPDSVYFELLNEPHDELTNDLWNLYAAEAIAIIRRSNPTRAIVVGPGDWNNVAQIKNLKLPDEDRNLIATFHYYLPFHFTHQGASWVGEQSKAWLGKQWTGSSKEKQQMSAHFDAARKWARDNDRPLYLGEFGSYKKADTASRVRWMSFVRSEAEKRSIPWTYWGFCADFGLYDRETKAWRPQLLKALIP